MPLEQPPLSLYVHLPWCVRKCPYCDFNSHEHSDPPEQAYLHALLEDLDAEVQAAQGRPIESLFFGGGTPSLLSGDFYHALLTELRARLEELNDRGRTILFIEHDMDVVMEHCDRVVVMHDGRTLAVGPPEIVQQDERVVEAYLGGGDR